MNCEFRALKQPALLRRRGPIFILVPQGKENWSTNLEGVHELL